jgi:hypothetical protein
MFRRFVAAKIGCKKGYTTIELMAVLTIMPLLSLSVYGIVDIAGLLFRYGGIYSDLSLGTAQAMRSMNREIGQSSPQINPPHFVISSDGNQNNIVRFQIPVDWNNDGSVVTSDASPVTEWGAYREVGQTRDGILNAWVRYRVSGGNLVRDLLNADLAQIAGTERIVVLNVERLQVTQSQGELNKVNVTVNLYKQEKVGKNGTAQDFRAVVNSQILLRNTAG